MSSNFQTGGSKGGDVGGEDVVKPLERKAPEKKTWGVARPVLATKFSFTVTPSFYARAVESSGFATSNSVIASSEVGIYFDRILANAQLSHELPERKIAFYLQMLRAFVLNSSSVSTPGRGRIHVTGCERTFTYAGDVVAVLGDDTRRFFRACAEDVYNDLKNLSSRVGALTTAEQEFWENVLRQAADRGLSRVPWFAFDTAEYLPVSILTPSERELVVSVGRRTAANATPLAERAVVAHTEAAGIDSRLVTGKEAPSSKKGAFLY